MIWLTLLFWLSAACVFYTYVGYPLLLALAARLRPGRRIRVLPALELPVSVVLAAFNEEANIGRRIRELVGLVAAHPGGGEVIVVSDGSTDRTMEVAQDAVAGIEAKFERMPRIPVQLIALRTNEGKASALNTGSAVASRPVLVFADTRQRWTHETLRRLVDNFKDPNVGAVSGDLDIEAAPGVSQGVALYWRYEKWVRRLESRIHSTVGVTGAVCAVRRRLYRAIPPGTILDDVYWPLLVVMGGDRVLHDESARAFDRLPDRASDEFRRKLRTLAGNFQLVVRLPDALLPRRNPIWWQFLSHKVLRHAVPWALLGLAASSAMLDGQPYRAMCWVQALLYSVALAGTFKPVAARLWPASAAAAFLILNVAAWLAFWAWVLGRATGSWNKVVYDIPPPATEPTAASAPVNLDP